jgi:kojibiose phosphorylase
MLPWLLADRFPPEVRDATFRFYEPRCGHGSSLSPAIYALVAARLGDMESAERYFAEAATIDLKDTFGNAAHGVHIGALGGLWQAVVFGFAGLSFTATGIRLDPRIPSSWGTLAFRIHWRGRRLRIEVDAARHTLHLEVECGEPLSVDVGGSTYLLANDRPVDLVLER